MFETNPLPVTFLDHNISRVAREVRHNFPGNDGDFDGDGDGNCHLKYFLLFSPRSFTGTITDGANEAVVGVQLINEKSLKLFQNPSVNA
jgi:hypothetical protein